MTRKDAPYPDSAWTAAAVASVLAARRNNSVVSPPPPSSHGLKAAVAGVRQHRVAELVAPHAAALGLEPRATASLQRARSRLLRGGLANAVDAALVSRLLNDAEIRHLIVKGAALTALVGHEPGTRGPGDVDVWVRPRDAGEAEAVLTAAGWHRRPFAAGFPQSDDGWRWRLLLWGGHELPLDHADRSGADLHWGLTPSPGELSFEFEAAYDRSVEVPIGATDVRTLAPIDALEHIAQHGRKEAWPVLRQLVDVVNLVDACGEDASRELARRSLNVSVAMGTAAYIAPWMKHLVDLDHSNTRRCLEAWNGCLALDRSLHHRRGLTGRAAIRARIAHEWWLMRSSPNWSTRMSYSARLMVPLRTLIDARARPRRRRHWPNRVSSVGDEGLEPPTSAV